MEIVYFKTDTSEPVEVVFDSGKISCTELGQLFRLRPESIRLNGSVFFGDSRSEWKKLKEFFRQRGRPVGATKDDPVTVTGDTAVPTLPTGVARELPPPPERLLFFARDARENYNKMHIHKDKFLLVSRDPFQESNDPFLIWIRKCYLDLREALASNKNLHRRFIILGTAGIGKSVFTIFWVCYLATQRVKVAWKTHPSQIFILDFSQEVATVSGPFNDFNYVAVQSVVQDASAWLILDGQQPDRLPYKCHMLLACSTKATNYAEFLKSDLAKRMYLPVWTQEEMDQFCDDFSPYRDTKLYEAMDVPDKEQVQENFKVLGGVPRYILKNRKMEDGRLLFEQAVSDLSAELCFKVLSGVFEQGLSDKIIHMCVGNVEGKCNYDKCVYTFASSKAQSSVWERLHSNMPVKIVEYMIQYWDNATYGPVMGVLYEKAALEILRRGGTFKRKRVWEEPPYNASAPNLGLGILDSSNFDDLKELENMKQSTCYKPTSRNFESVDAIISPVSSVDVPRLVQIFKRKGGQNHGHKLHGLTNVDNVLKSTKYELLSIVPSDCYTETEFQTWRHKDGKKCVRLTPDERTLVAKMEQYVVEVDFKALVPPGA